MSKKLILDENLPHRLKTLLSDYQVFTLEDMKWKGKKNGVLMRLMNQNKVDVFVTMDKGISNQQNLSSLSFGIILLRAKNNQFATLEPLMTKVMERLADLKPGDVIEITE